MRKNRVDVFVAFAAKEIATESDVEFQLELLSLRDAMDQLAQVQLDLTQMTNSWHGIKRR